MHNNKPLVLTYDNLVVGSSLEALLFAYQNSYSLICTRLEVPYYFEEIEDFELGTNKLEIWNKYMYLLSLAGLCPFSDKIKFLRYKEHSQLKAVTQGEKVVTVKYNNLFVFDDHNFYDLPVENGITTKDIMVVDWLKVLSGRHHDLEVIKRDSEFINKLIFYYSGKMLFGKQSKDCIALSYLKDHQLYKDSYAEYVVRIKTQSIMEEHGIKQTGTAKISVEHIKRDVVKLGKNIYENFDNVQFMYITPKEAWFSLKKYTKINYQRYIKAKLGL
jgi:hypothetical protein